MLAVYLALLLTTMFICRSIIQFEKGTVLCVHTTEFDCTKYPGCSTAATAANCCGQYKTVASSSAGATNIGAECPASDRREHVLPDHCRHAETGNSTAGTP